MKNIFVTILFLVGLTSASPPANQGYFLVWSDEFDGTTLDTNTWSYDTGLSYGADWQAYTNHNVTIENGAMVLWAKHEKHGGYNYTSSYINTKGKQEFKYGYIEVRLKGPFGSGPVASFWMQGTNSSTVPWPKCGEIQPYGQNTGPRYLNTDTGDSCFVVRCVFQGASGLAVNSFNHNYTECLCNDYHLYGIEWDSLRIVYFFDGNKFWEYDTINETYNLASFHQPYYFLANMTVKAPRDTSIFPQKMWLNYVRVYQKSTQVSANPQKRIHEDVILVDPSKAQLKVYNTQGRLIADYSNIARFTKPGGNLLKGVSSTLSAGAYLVRLFDGRKTFSEKLILSK